MTVVHGQAIGTPRIAGRVNAIDVHPGGNRAYAASANGGVWYTSDGGVHWISLGGFAPTGGAQIIRPAHRHVTTGSWHGSPDVRPRRAPVSRPTPATLPWTKTTGGIDAELLRHF
jgi:hypothetical protein